MWGHIPVTSCACHNTTTIGNRKIISRSGNIDKWETFTISFVFTDNSIFKTWLKKQTIETWEIEMVMVGENDEQTDP